MSFRKAGIGMTSLRTRARMIERLRSDGIKDEVVLDAMGEVPRHLFVDEALASRAYEDTPLPLGFGQTISSPYIVARMTELLRQGRPLDNVLEIGTGCGYQTAILARVACEVHTIERIGPLLNRARALSRELRIRNVRFQHSDGSAGLAQMAPFDGILITAAATHLPTALLDQLRPGGRMVLPIGVTTQFLHVVERTESEFVETRCEEVRFVPLLPGIE